MILRTVFQQQQHHHRHGCCPIMILLSLLLFVISVTWMYSTIDSSYNVDAAWWTGSGSYSRIQSSRQHYYYYDIHHRRSFKDDDHISLIRQQNPKPLLSSSIQQNENDVAFKNDDDDDTRSPGDPLVAISSKTSSSSNTLPSVNDILDNIGVSLLRILQTMSMILSSSSSSQKSQSDNDNTEKIQKDIVQHILQICDECDEITNIERNIKVPQFNDWVTIFQNEDSYYIRDTIQYQIGQSLHRTTLLLEKSTLQYQRYELLVRLMQTNYTTYITTASFLCSSSSSDNTRQSKIQRYELPNVQDVPYITTTSSSSTTAAAGTGTTISTSINDVDDDSTLVPDCTLNDMEYNDSILDQLLLYIFRSLVTKHTNGITSPISGIQGLLEQGRTFMIQQKDNPPEVQHNMVQNTLRDLMTPILPPFYRIFMSGIVPQIKLPNNDSNNISIHTEEKQYGPWFYAPFLTTIITPIFFKFLVGPSYPNRHRYTGDYGGLLVTKCKFLQESNCKGLCLHQCKIPAQNFFNTTLGLHLNVVPNFVTQECQWNFNEIPIIPVSDDISFPRGCIQGCTSRTIMKEETGSSSAPLCN